jgi:Asp-tRNA(Asn)/Glu-tRNA(Gln) amidotransferase A subunit family amidase
MALAWSMDKVGPIARNASDLASVFDAVRGADERDPSSRDAAFRWPLARPLKQLRIGVVEELFDEDYAKWADEEEEIPGLKEWQQIDREALKTLHAMGLRLEPLKLPSDLPVSALSIILTAEAATAFDGMTRSGADAELARQVRDAWPTVFRQGQMLPAVEYVRANRIRLLLMREIEKALEGFDAWIAPTFGGDVLLTTNLTGHPTVVVPNGFRPSDGTPTSLSFLGRLDGEATVLALAEAFQQVTDFHTRRPPLKPAGTIEV